MSLVVVPGQMFKELVMLTRDRGAGVRSWSFERRLTPPDVLW